MGYLAGKMKQSCPECHTILEINDDDYTPGEIVTKECPLCDAKIEFVIPEKITPLANSESEVNTTSTSGGGVITEKTSRKKVIRVSATKEEKQKVQPQPQKTPLKDRKEEKTNNSGSIFIYVLSIFAALLVVGGILWYFVLSDKTEEPTLENYAEQEPEYIDYQGYMDWEYGITLRISNGEGIVDGVYNNNRYQSTFLDMKGSRSGSHYTLTLYKKDGSEMGKFTLTRTGCSMLGNYYDTKSNTDHRVEISSDPNNPIPWQEDPEKVAKREQEELERQAEIEYESDQNFRDSNGHSYVDLGLPSGLCWATCNLGASSPTSNGEHYSWGETSEKYEYTQSSYNCNLGSRMLTSSNDAASVQWGGTWRMPTSEEWQELDTYCTWSWDGEGYYVKGNNGNSIFLPAAGYSKGSSRFKAGERGDYWTSTPCGSEKAYEFVIKSDSRRIENDNRHYGLSIRPVIE